jgi:hypothetical protein
MPTVIAVKSNAIESGEVENEEEKETIATLTDEKKTNDSSSAPAADVNELNTPSHSSTAANPIFSNTTKQNDILSPAIASLHPETPNERKAGSSTIPIEEGISEEQQQQQKQHQAGKVRPKRGGDM